VTILESTVKGAERVFEGGAHTAAKNRYLRDAASGAFKDKKGMDRWKETGHIMSGYMEEAVEKGGFSSAWTMAGHHAVRGAVVGGAIGGTTSALNGGSFWDGAKAGAFKGATIYGGLRMGQAATGATSLNPFAGKGKGALSSALNIHSLTGGKNVKVSKQAAKILAQRQGDGLVRGVNNLYSK
jgi:hypothetical protein